MPKVVHSPKGVKPYLFHGLDLDERGVDQYVGTCPFCDKDDKFFVAVETGQYDCKVCGDKGNVYTFLRKMWETAAQQSADHLELSDNRRLLWAQTLDEWGVRASHVDGTWMVPGYNQDGKLCQLYRYLRDAKTHKMRLMATPDFGGDEKVRHQLFGVHLYDPAKPIVYLCEGPWDAMCLYEMLRSTRLTDDGSYRMTTSEEGSLYASINVLAVPGCNVFNPTWAPLFAGKKVVMFYDNDHKRMPPKTGQDIPPAAYEGMKRVAEILTKDAEEPPSEMHFLFWGEGGYDSSLPSGYDVRDYITGTQADPHARAERVTQLGNLLANVKPVPPQWVHASKAPAKNGQVAIELLPCESYKKLVNSWKKAMKWTDGLDRALSCMLASISSTMAVGDQLWVKVVGPPACGKSTLCEAVSSNKQYVVAKSTIRGFHSGFKTDKKGEEDHSLIAMINGKTLVTKDGDALLQSPNLGQILSEARDLYDSVSRTHYRHGLQRDYEGVRMTWILCGTSSLRSLDASELGERFLDCIIMEDIDPDLEDLVLARVASRAERNTHVETNCKLETQHDEAMLEAVRLTGGYVKYLRANAFTLSQKVHFSSAALNRCVRLAKFVSYMRARPSTRQEEVVEREFGTRLTCQLVRLAKFTAVVMNRGDIDEEVLRRVTRIALDTARGRTLVITKHLYDAGEKGTDLRPLAIRTTEGEDKLRTLLVFLRKLGVAELPETKADPRSGIKPRARWRLTERMRQLYKEAVLG